MRKQLRWLLPIVAIVVISIVVLSLSPFSIFGFTRGDNDNILGVNLGLDLQGGAHFVYMIVPPDDRPLTDEDAAALRDVISQRINRFGVSEPSVSLLGGTPPDRLLVQIPGQLSDPSVEAVYYNGLFTEGTSPVNLTPDELQTLARIELERDDVTVSLGSVITNPDGTNNVGYNFTFENFVATQRDSMGNVVVEGDIERLEEFLDDNFTPVISVGFITPSVDNETGTADPMDGSETSNTVPDSSQLANTIIDAGITQFIQVGEAETAAEGLITYSIRPDTLVLSSRDEDGQFVPGDIEIIDSALREQYDTLIGVSYGGVREYLRTIGGIEDAKALIGSTALLEFRERTCSPVQAPPNMPEWPPDGITAQAWEFERCNNPRYYLEQTTEIDSADLVSARVGTQEGIAGPVVNIEFNNDGAEAFLAVTSRISNTGDLLAIYLDGEELLAPGASAPISGGRAYISGDFTATGDFAAAGLIAIQLQSGALPAELDLLQEREVDATLGSDALSRSLVAAAIGLALLALFLIMYYKVPGMISTLTLIIYALALLAVIKLVPVTLTLSGLAALILSLGFAVDANILIAERMKEEIKSGKNIYNAITAGFSRAWPSIRDGNLSTLLIALVLFWFGDRFGTSLIQGFALTLGIGIILSMLFSYLVNRVLIRIAAYSPLGKRIGLFIPVPAQVRKEKPLLAGVPNEAVLTNEGVDEAVEDLNESENVEREESEVPANEEVTDVAETVNDNEPNNEDTENEPAAESDEAQQPPDENVGNGDENKDK